MNKTPVKSANDALSPALGRFLYLTSAITGAAVMIVEILGAKMLSPYVGTSHFVWTAQITITLIALSLGYYVGGRVADRTQQAGSLYWCILVAAAYLAGTVTITQRVAYFCLEFNLAVGSLLAATFLFFIPLSLLAMVGPFVVRMLTATVSDVGSTMGRLTAISTLGSVIGTLLISYVVIPFLPNSLTMYLTSLLLVVPCAIYFLAWSRKSAIPVSLMMVLIACIGWIGARPVPLDTVMLTEVYRCNSNFGQMQVVDNKINSTRYYLNDFLTQNTYDTDTQQSTSLFTHMLHGLARTYNSNVTDVLCIGLGVGIVPMEFAREHCKVDVVEINPAVIPLAEKYFDLHPTQLNLTIGDGRILLNQCKKKYDVVALDAFLGESSPSHLMTREAFEEIRRVLKPDGVLVINSFGSLDPGLDFFTTSLDKTLRAVFPSVRIHAYRSEGNIFFVAAQRTPLNFFRPPWMENIHPNVVSMAEAAYANTLETNPKHGQVLTDDFNPVDFFDAKNRENIRKRLALDLKPD